jgi:hypothetical protein
MWLNPQAAWSLHPQDSCEGRRHTGNTVAVYPQVGQGGTAETAGTTSKT